MITAQPAMSYGALGSGENGGAEGIAASNVKDAAEGMRSQECAPTVSFAHEVVCG